MISLLGWAVALPSALASEGAPLSGNLRAIEVQSRFELSWPAVADAVYRVQMAVDLAGTPGEWKTIDVIRAPSSSLGPVKWLAPEALTSRAFYRLSGPDPEIFSVEPAWVDSSDPNAALYLVGQCLPTNATVLINGESFAATRDSSGALRVSLLGGALPGGAIISSAIRVIDKTTSNIIAEWTVQSPLVYGTEMNAEQLQGPPNEPPASPTLTTAGKPFVFGHGIAVVPSDQVGAQGRAFLSKKGYDYYQARSDLAASSLQNNPAFQENNNQGQMPDRALIHAYLSKKGYDYYQAQSALMSAREGTSTRSRSNIQNNRLGLLETEDTAVGNSGGTPLNRTKGSTRSRSNIQNNRLVVTGGDDDCDGVFAPTGEFRWRETDIKILGRGLDFAWTRTYRSRTGPSTAQGAGWDYSYNVSLAPQANGTMVLRTGDGRASTFYPDGTNGWLRDEYFLTIADLDQDGIPEVVTFADTGKWVFNPPGTAAAGKLSQIVDRSGNTIALHYDVAGRLSTIVDDLGRTNTLAYNPTGQIESLTDFNGRVVRYEYSGNGDLVACISPAVTGTPTGNDFPGGLTNRYAYTSGFADDRLNHNLTACIDAKGQTWLQVVYQPTNNPGSLDFDAVDYVQHGLSREHLRRYSQVPSPTNAYARVKVVLRDALGNVTECFYDSRHRCVRLLEYTGRSNPDLPVTEADNRPAGKLRADDPDQFETKWSWNPDSLCTRETRPGGDSTEIVHQRVQDHNSSRSNKTASRRHDGDLRVLRERASSPADLDGDGQAETTELAWYFEYDPRFGSSGSRVQDHNSSRSNKSSSVLNDDDDGDESPMIRGSAKKWSPSTFRVDLPGLPAARQASKGSRSYRRVLLQQGRFGFPTVVTDPRGGQLQCLYDGSGNLTQKRKMPGRTSFQPITLEAGVTDDFTYNLHGQLTGITNAPDANGARRVDTFTYHASGPQAGYLASIAIDEPGVHLTTAFERDAHGNVTRLVDPRNNDWLFTYNALDQCVRAQSPTNSTVRCSTTHLRYDPNGNVVETISELHNETDTFVRNVSGLAEFDLLDRCTALTEQVSPGVFRTNRFLYGGNGRLTTVLSPLAVSGADPHNQVAFEYDERGLLFREIAAPGTGLSGTNEYTYNANGQLKLKLGTANGGFERPGIGLAYNGFGQLLSVTDPMSNVVSYAHDRIGNLTRVRCFGETNDVPGGAGNRLLAETRYAYDGLDRCVQQIESFFDVFTLSPIGDGQAVTAFTYSPNGACTSVTDDNGRVTRYAYDTAGRCSQITDAKTNIVQFTYDAGGNLTGMISIERPDSGGAEQQFSRSYTYDALGRCVQTVDNVGNASTCAYDSLGRVVSQTNPNGVLSVSQFDDLGHRLKLFVDKNADGKIGPDELRQLAARDANSQLISFTDANSNTTLYAYDSLGRSVSVTYADGTSRHLAWSPRSNLLSVEDANGTTVTNLYDLCGRIIHRDIAVRGGAAGTTTFETFQYDGFSRCVAASNNASLVSFAFDSLGNCVRSTQDGLTTTSTFDGVGNCTSMTYPSGGTVTCTYDNLDQLASVGRSAGGGLPPTLLASYSYDGPGRLARIARANGVETRVQWSGKVNPPNAPGDFGWRQVSGVSHQEAAGARTVLDRRASTFDRNQNKLSRAQTVPFHVGGATTTNLFTYDALDRLTQFARERGTPDDFRRLYGLDGNGNRLFAASNGVVAPYIMEATIPPADFQMDQYTVTPFANQAYDDNGNLILHGSATGALQYVYDYADRLVAVNDLGSGAPSPVATYAYDALGRRIGRTIYPAGGMPPVMTLFVHNGGDCDDEDPIEEHDNGTLKKTYVIPHVVEQKGRIAGKTYVIPHVFEQKGRMMIPAGGGTFHLHTDELGNALALTDEAGTVVERYDYDDFGLPSILTSDGLPTGESSSGAGNPFLFRGAEWDAETGFYHGGNGGCFDPQTAKSVNSGTPNRISMNVTVSKQTQGATFGERVNAGLNAAGSAVAQGASLLGGSNPWTLKKEEGGRHTPFHNKYRPQLSASQNTRDQLKSYFETGDVPMQGQFRKAYGKPHELKGHVTLIK